MPLNATDFLPYCRLLGEGITLEDISSLISSPSTNMALDDNTTAEDRLMKIKDLEKKPFN
jgi:hypothetical protein